MSVVQATSNKGVVFDYDTVVDGGAAWSDADYKLTNIPPHLVGGALVRTQHGKILEGTIVTLTAGDAGSCRVYVSVESEGPRKKDCAAAKGRDGGLLTRLAEAPIWSGEEASPSWCGEDSVMATFSAPLMAGGSLTLPEIVESGAVILIVAVPIFVKSFSVSMTSTAEGQVYRAVPVEEGVTAWQDREHRLTGVPGCLLGGTLFQGPKALPDGTALAVWPSTRARVYALLEKAGSGGLDESIPAKGWRPEPGAPRWHDTATLAMYSRPCGAGCGLCLPPTRGAEATLCVVVVPEAAPPVAALEVSALVPGGPRVEALDFAALEEGVSAWRDEGHRLTQVPDWMKGATLVRGAHSGPPAGALFSVRSAAPSVVYAMVEGELMNRPGRSGGLLPDALLSDGWERRDQVPEWKAGSRLAVLARRVAARQPLCLPPLANDGAIFMLVAKTDVEAFDVTLETSEGTEFDRAKIEETMLVWSDCQNRLAWIPTSMKGGTFFRGPQIISSGTKLCLHGSTPFRAYVVVEIKHKNRPARSGGFPDSLPKAGWHEESAAPSWGDTAATLRVFSHKVGEGSQLVLPATSGDASLVVVAVSLTSSPDRVAEELKRVFRAWDVGGKGGMRKEDLRALLDALCPGIERASREALLAQCDRPGSSALSYEEFVDRVVLASARA